MTIGQGYRPTNAGPKRDRPPSGGTAARRPTGHNGPAPTDQRPSPNPAPPRGLGIDPESFVITGTARLIFGHHHVCPTCDKSFEAEARAVGEHCSKECALLAAFESRLTKLEDRQSPIRRWFGRLFRRRR